MASNDFLLYDGRKLSVNEDKGHFVLTDNTDILVESESREEIHKFLFSTQYGRVIVNNSYLSKIHEPQLFILKLGCFPENIPLFSGMMDGKHCLVYLEGVVMAENRLTWMVVIARNNESTEERERDLKLYLYAYHAFLKSKLLIDKFEKIKYFSHYDCFESGSVRERYYEEILEEGETCILPNDKIYVAKKPCRIIVGNTTELLKKGMKVDKEKGIPVCNYCISDNYFNSSRKQRLFCGEVSNPCSNMRMYIGTLDPRLEKYASFDGVDPECCIIFSYTQIEEFTNVLIDRKRDFAKSPAELMYLFEIRWITTEVSGEPKHEDFLVKIYKEADKFIYEDLLSRKEIDDPRGNLGKLFEGLYGNVKIIFGGTKEDLIAVGDEDGEFEDVVCKRDFSIVSRMRFKLINPGESKATAYDLVYAKADSLIKCINKKENGEWVTTSIADGREIGTKVRNKYLSGTFEGFDCVYEQIKEVATEINYSERFKKIKTQPKKPLNKLLDMTSKMFCSDSWIEQE